MRSIPVFVRGTDTPIGLLEWDAARELVAWRRAEWRNHARAVRLLAAFDLRDFSCRFLPSAILSASAERRAAIDAWGQLRPKEIPDD